MLVAQRGEQTGPSVIQRGMFHVHLAQAQIPPAGKLFSGQPPVIRGLLSTAQPRTVLSPRSSSSSLCAFSFCSSQLPDIHIYLLMNLFTSPQLPDYGALSCPFIANLCAASAPPTPPLPPPLPPTPPPNSRLVLTADWTYSPALLRPDFAKNDSSFIRNASLSMRRRVWGHQKAAFSPR